MRDYFKSDRFHKVVALHEDENASWEQLSKCCPDLPRGWYELSRLTAEDRVDFTRGFWAATLPYHPRTQHPIECFFKDLDDVGVLMTQEKEGTPFEFLLIYSLADGSGFYWGKPPADRNEVLSIRAAHVAHELPLDYLAFFKIHNGFGKADDTGILPVEEVPERLQLEAPLTLRNRELVNGEHLIPFYQSYGIDSYQCFYADWYPEQEMGNLYYSAQEHSLSDPQAKGSGGETLAFPTFLDWLVFYLECIR